MKGETGDVVSRGSEQALRQGSRSFNAAATLLDPATRESARLLYAWCRHVDDEIDGQVLGRGELRGAAAGTLATLRWQTLEASQGLPQAHPAFEALRRVMAAHVIPASEPLTLIDGCAMDVEGRRYETIDDTLDYSYHVAGVVGLMMARVLGVRDDRVFDRACDLGLAFQLTNIARDVVEDHRGGRVYLPARWLADESLDRETMALPANRASLHRVAVRLLEAAEPYYDSARRGIEALPRRSAWAIGTAWSVYRAIGERVRTAGPAAWDARPVVPAGRKARFALQAGLATLLRRNGSVGPDRAADLWARPRNGQASAETPSRAANSSFSLRTGGA